MSDRQKYAFNGVYFLENAREHMERNDFPQIQIGTIGGIAGWYLTMQQKVINNEAGYGLFIHTRERKPMLKYRIYLNIMKSNRSSEIPYEHSGYLVPTFGPCGKRKTIGNWLNEENRYLISSGILVEYGFQIEKILNEDNIWTFNFYDPLFDSEEKKDMITFYKDLENGERKHFYSHKQLVTFHSTYFHADFDEKIEIDNFDDLLQITHGVRGKIDSGSPHQILKHARKYNLFNAIHIVDQALLWDSSLLISDAISLGLNHYLAHLLRKQESLEELVGELNKVDLETMSGEAMKKCVMFLLDF